MKRLLLVLMLTAMSGCLMPCFAQTSDVKLTWDASEGADGYKVYFGVAPNDYGEPVDVGSTLLYTVEGLNEDCTSYFFAVTAHNAIGESGFSNEVSVVPRPVALVVHPSETNDAVWFVDGANFAPNVTGTINNQPFTFVRDGCERLSFEVASVQVPLAWATLQLCNPAAPQGRGAVCQSVVLNPVGAPGNLAVQ